MSENESTPPAEPGTQLPATPPEQPQANPAAQPIVPKPDVDVNQMIANIEAETAKRETDLKAQIMEEANKKFSEQMKVQQEASNKVLAEMKAQLDVLNAAAQEQKKTVIEEYKTKLAETASQLNNAESQLSQRTTNIQNNPNPYRAIPQVNPNGETLDPDAQKAELAKMYNAVNGKEF